MDFRDPDTATFNSSPILGPMLFLLGGQQSPRRSRGIDPDLRTSSHQNELEYGTNDGLFTAKSLSRLTSEGSLSHMAVCQIGGQNPAAQ